MTDKNKKPDLNSITAADLADNLRLRELYMQCCRAGFWRSNDGSSVLTFWSLAEKALQEDKRGTPGALFYGLIKRKDYSKITNAQEDRAMSRLNSAERNVVHFDAAKIKPVQARLPLDPEEVSHQFYGQLGYHHGVMMQCFMPQQRFDGNVWQANHGKATLGIQAGLIQNPKKGGELKQCAIPYGSKSRLIIPYVNNYYIQHKTPVVDMGKSLRRFVEGLGYSYGGAQGRAFAEQVQNVAAAQFILGFWENEGESTTQWANVANKLSFWIDRDPAQSLMWEQEMVLSSDYCASIDEHRVPMLMEHLVQLASSARAQDIYAWLCYRLPRLKKPLNLPYDTLQTIFGQGIQDPYFFRQKWRADLRKIHSVYDGFQIETPKRKDYVQFFPSKSPVPPKVTRLVP